MGTFTKPYRGGRPTPLNDPEFVDKYALALAEGLTNDQLAETFNIGLTSVKTYKRDARVKSALGKYIEDRILRISRKVDATVEAHLEMIRSDATLTTKDKVELLLKIRREFLGGAFRMQAEGGKLDAQQVNAAMDQLESDPSFAAELRDLFERSST